MIIVKFISKSELEGFLLEIIGFGERNLLLIRVVIVILFIELFVLYIVKFRVYNIFVASCICKKGNMWFWK